MRALNGCLISHPHLHARLDGEESETRVEMNKLDINDRSLHLRRRFLVTRNSINDCA
jgi:hypothetical protein